jgi:hypothetical protein
VIMFSNLSLLHKIDGNNSIFDKIIISRSNYNNTYFEGVPNRRVNCVEANQVPSVQDHHQNASLAPALPHLAWRP